MNTLLAILMVTILTQSTPPEARQPRAFLPFVAAGCTVGPSNLPAQPVRFSLVNEPTGLQFILRHNPCTSNTLFFRTHWFDDSGSCPRPYGCWGWPVPIDDNDQAFQVLVHQHWDTTRTTDLVEIFDQEGWSVGINVYSLP